MPKYLIEGRYNSDGVKGMAREGGTARRAEVAKLVESFGGKLEAVYYAFGDVDVYVILDLPDEISAVAASLAANQTGVVSARFVPLITPETFDAATKRVPAYRGPGQ